VLVEREQPVRLVTQTEALECRVARQHLTLCSQAEALLELVAVQQSEQAERDQCRQTLAEPQAHRVLLEGLAIQDLRHLTLRSADRAERVLAA
jgi:uncharacterized paraquat-inducible protein A